MPSQGLPHEICHRGVDIQPIAARAGATTLSLLGGRERRQSSEEQRLRTIPRQIALARRGGCQRAIIRIFPVRDVQSRPRRTL